MLKRTKLVSSFYPSIFILIFHVINNSGLSAVLFFFFHSLPFYCFSYRGECTETLRNRIRELETECKKLTIDIKLKEDQIRELEMKVQVKRKYQGLRSAHNECFQSPETGEYP